jgi:hypothetical protein
MGTTMIKQIICSKCALPTDVKTIRRKKGTALEDFTCNRCCKSIHKGTLCYAETITEKGSRYRKWEFNYIMEIL